ncbi:MAG TPA: hypothetical protein VJ732_11520 [Bryobacteraceae bacterium]|nr:hypothetical protein [Bryobacteraceae bacterium]
MASYISSNANRLYAALESAYGSAAAVQAGNRIPALRLTVRQRAEVTARKDKTGSRTFPGLPAGGRRSTEWELQTCLTGWQGGAAGPGYGPLFQAALGGAPKRFPGGTAASGAGNGSLALVSPHGLSVGQAVASGGEIRFVSAIVDANTVQLNAPFTVIPAAGSRVGATITYTPATELPSVTVFDYWEPAAAVQRLLCGAAVDQMEIVVNGDYHEFHFSGIAQDLLDSSSFVAGAAQLAIYPAEPELAAFDYSIVPGNMGQAWLGSSPEQFFTVTGASIVVKNDLETRAREFGSSLPRAIAPGQRNVTAAFDLYGMDNTATHGLYQAARQQSPVTVMLQLGALEGQVMGVNLKSVVLEVPEFDDSQNRLQWRFGASRSQGTVNDEIAVAFA